MKRILFSFLSAGLLSAGAVAEVSAPGYPITPVPFTAVHVSGPFWGARIEASRNVTIPLAFAKCEENERYANFVRAAHPSEEYKVTGFSFDDTDVYKTIEGAAYRLHNYPDKKLEAYIDSVIDIMAAAQEPDGYLYTARTQNPAHPHEWAGKERWTSVENLSHEFYNLGHMIEGAVAYYQATGKRKFLDIACRYADCVDRNIGEGEGKLRLVPGHQIAEMALVRLYNVTGEKRYFDLAKFFLDARGTTARRQQYSQSHIPVVQQSEAVGHAVRATYMYAGMADVAAISGDTSYIHAVDRIWDNIVGKKLYITGGIGARHRGEAFGDNYELPNASAYNETCAAIGNVYTNYRLFLLLAMPNTSTCSNARSTTASSRAFQLTAAVSSIPTLWPLPAITVASRGLVAHGLPKQYPAASYPRCPGYIYAVKDKSLYVNLFMPNTARLDVGGQRVTVSQFNLLSLGRQYQAHYRQGPRRHGFENPYPRLGAQPGCPRRPL